MSTSADRSPSENTYIIDAENAAEMARLTNQDRLITRTMGGLFPEGVDLTKIHDILDIGCGPGGWILDVAHAYPKTRVIGIDISRLTVEYARAQGRQRELNNASFRVMDVLKSLDFPEGSFDLVNARFITGFMSKNSWAALVQACMRVTRTRGIILLTEYESTISNSLACEKLFGMLSQAMWLAGQSFSPDGRNVGITPMLGRFMRDAGYINIQKKAYVLDSSAGMEEHASQYQNTVIFLKLIQPFLIKMGVTTREEVDMLYHRALAEIVSNDYCAVWFWLTEWGQKP